MYKYLKRLLSRFISRKTLMRHELLFRKPHALLYSGNAYICTVCKTKLSKFILLPNNDLLCPACGSISRNRRLWQILNEGYLIDGITVLDFSPSRSLWRNMKRIDNIIYISTDLSGDFMADYAYDITNIDLPSESVDLIICYHILEHVPDDEKAMKELFRILKTKGQALIQTPFKGGDIYEDFSITEPLQRAAHFGQDDHVRVYSVKGLAARLERSGFNVQVKKYNPEKNYGFTEETVLVVTKP